MQVAHVLPPPLPVVPVAPYAATLSVEPFDVTEELAEAHAEEERQGNALLERVIATIAQKGRPAAPVLLRGDAASELIAYVQQEGIDLIVTGSRGLGRMQSWLMGSVSRKLVHYSGCSMLVVRASSG